ncbi:MAG: OFA family MFS transporter [Ktedonobacteraceae bacterium]
MSSSSTSSSGVPNRWLIAIAAFFMQLALGAVYAWSVYLTPVTKVYHVSKVEGNLTFSIMLLALGITAGFGGSLNLRYGPRITATVGGILYGLGILLAGLTTGIHSIILLYITYGIIGGIGVGLAYIVPIAMLVKWFPDRRGFITGLAVAGFGAGAALTAPLSASVFIPTFGLSQTFLLLGIIYLIIVVLTAQVYRPAPEGYTPAGWTPSAQQATVIAARTYTFKEALRLPRWYLLWLMLALNTTAGAALISVASPFAVSFTHVTVGIAAVLVITISIFNGAGRLFWAWVSDFIGRPLTFLCMFLIQVIVFFLLPSVGSFALLLIPASIIGLCYGGGFGTMPAFVADYFGPKNAGTIYGAMLTAWSAGGILGPILITSMETRTALYVIAGILLISAALPLVVINLARRRGDLVEPAEIPTKARA